MSDDKNKDQDLISPQWRERINVTIAFVMIAFVTALLMLGLIAVADLLF